VQRGTEVGIDVRERLLSLRPVRTAADAVAQVLAKIIMKVVPLWLAGRRSSSTALRRRATTCCWHGQGTDGVVGEGSPPDQGLLPCSPDFLTFPLSLARKQIHILVPIEDFCGVFKGWEHCMISALTK
jgi:hypothetical protein